jgi:hypothetical protein
MDKPKRYQDIFTAAVRQACNPGRDLATGEDG